MPLFDRVLAGHDEDLANRVRAVLRMPQVLRPRAAAAPASIDAKIMAERSIKAGYMKDALKYLEVAHESDPGDFDVMLKLAWTNNILHRDAIAFRWFDLARRSPDPTIAADAREGLSQSARRDPALPHLRLALSPVFHPLARPVLLRPAEDRNQSRVSRPPLCQRTLCRRYPPHDRRRQPAVSLGKLLHPGGGSGHASLARPHAWGEAGTAISYLKGHMLPDYRGGLSVSRTLRREGSRWNADATLDALYISRFDHDFLVYGQSRAGYDLGPVPSGTPMPRSTRAARIGRISWKRVRGSASPSQNPCT